MTVATNRAARPARWPATAVPRAYQGAYQSVEAAA